MHRFVHLASIVCLAAAGCSLVLSPSRRQGESDVGSDAPTADSPLPPDVPVDVGALDVPTDSPAGPCDFVANTGCAAGERCAYVRDAMGPGEVRCVADGVVAPGGACTVDGAGLDDCVGGSFCLNGACAATCELGGRACSGPTACVAFVDLPGGLCVSSCDPLRQTRPDGTTCPAGQSCYLLPSDPPAFVCAGTGMVAVGGEITGTPFANSCVAGATPVRDGAGVARCAALCQPAPTSSASPGSAGGVSPYSCAEVGAAGTECLYGWFLSATTIPDARLNGFGVCFDRTGRMFDDDGDGTDEISWPSCTTRSPTDDPGDPNSVPENVETYCAPYPF